LQVTTKLKSEYGIDVVSVVVNIDLYDEDVNVEVVW